MAQELKKIKTNLKRGCGTLLKLTENLDTETYNSDNDTVHIVQQIDSVIGYLNSSRKDLVDYSLSNCVECADLDKRLKVQLLKKLDDINKLKK